MRLINSAFKDVVHEIGMKELDHLFNLVGRKKYASVISLIDNIGKHPISETMDFGFDVSYITTFAFEPSSGFNYRKLFSLVLEKAGPVSSDNTGCHDMADITFKRLQKKIDR